MKEKAFEYIDAIAAKLGVAAEHVYGVLVKQAYVSGITSIVGSILFVLIIGLLTVFAYKMSEKDGLAADVFDVVAGVGTLVLAVGIIIGFFVSIDGVRHLLNPEYYAIKEILEVIGGK